MCTFILNYISTHNIQFTLNSTCDIKIVLIYLMMFNELELTNFLLSDSADIFVTEYYWIYIYYTLYHNKDLKRKVYSCFSQNYV